MAEKICGEYWLHVTELKLDREPGDLPFHHVIIILTATGLVEQTTIPNARLGREEWLVVQPRGHGWIMHDGESDKVTVWRRPHIATTKDKIGRADEK